MFLKTFQATVGWSGFGSIKGPKRDLVEQPESILGFNLFELKHFDCLTYVTVVYFLQPMNTELLSGARTIGFQAAHWVLFYVSLGLENLLHPMRIALRELLHTGQHSHERSLFLEMGAVILIKWGNLLSLLVRAEKSACFRFHQQCVLWKLVFLRNTKIYQYSRLKFSISTFPILTSMLETCRNPQIEGVQVLQYYFKLTLMSFLMQCCQSGRRKEVYELRMKQGQGGEKLQYTDELKKEEINKLQEKMTSAVRIRTSDYHELCKKYKGKQMFTDETFPPTMASIGTIPDLPPGTHWKRIPEIVKNPQMIVDGIEPTDIVQKRLNKCYFLSTVATLAQKNERIETIFVGQQFSPNGIYRVKLRVNGFIREVIIDDYVPVDEDGQPLFCQPNESQIWVMILEKAWAKLKGSYEKISYGNPTEVFKAVTYSPAQLFAITESSYAGDKIWEDLEECLRQGKPVCAGTKSANKIPNDAKDNGLVWDHFYTIMDATTLKDSNNQFYRVMKLRNPWGKVEWEGEYAEGDTDFWDKVPPSPSKKRIVGMDQVKTEEDGIFFMGYTDFCKNFESLHICHMVDRPFYEITRVFFDGKHGQIYLLTVKQEGEFIIELHQSQDKYDPRTGQRVEYHGEEMSRATIIAMKPTKYQFIDGAFTYDENDTTLRLKLFPGKHLIYIKMDLTSQGYLPFKTSLSCYSESLVTLKKLNKAKLGNFYEEMFSEYANHNKKKTFNNEKMWMTWKQFYQKGGLAFVAFGNDIISDKKFIVTFSEKDFDDMNYILKKPYKGKGKICLEIEPGDEKIIVARVKKGPPQEMSFPPNISVKIEKI